LDAQDNIYVADNSATIKVFDGENGTLIHSFGVGVLQSPCGLAFDPISQKIVVTDGNHNNLNVF